MKQSTLSFNRAIIRRTLLSLTCCMALVANADVVGGEVYTIVLANANNKTLFVEDSSPDSLVCMWTETHVPAQQWRVVRIDGQTFAFQNLYTGKYLSYSDNTARGSRIGQEMNVSSKSKWTLQPVDAQDNVYSFTIGGCTLCSTDTINRRHPILSNNASGYRWKEWKLVKVDNPITEFNAQARDEMLNDYIRKFIHVPSITDKYKRSNSLISFGNGGWSDVETMEVILDAYEETHSPNIRSLFYKLYDVVKWGVGDNWTGGALPDTGYAWYGYDFNDDVAWMLITAARAYHLFGKQEYLDDAKRNFDAIYKRGMVAGQGLIRWAERSGVDPVDGSCTINSCVNGPMEVAACYIAMGSGDESYFEKARDLYAHQRKELANMSTGQVFDSYRVSRDGMTRTGDHNNWASTYNQGTMMGAAVLLYNHYRDPQYKKDAEKIMEYVQKNMCRNSYDVLRNWNVSGNLGGFKGILMRYVRRLIVDCGDSQYIPWIKANAFRAYNNRNSQGFSSSAWLEKSSENMVALNGEKYDGFFQCGTAVSAAVNVPLGTTDSNGNDIKTSAATFEAELADFNGNVKIDRDAKASFGMYVENLGRKNNLSFDYVAPEDGVYNVKVYYMGLMDCDMSVSNGSEKLVKFPKTGGWTPTHMDTMTVQLEMKKGVNTIVVGNSKRASSCPNIDKFEVTLNYSTGIVPVKSTANKADDDRWYNLQGQQVTAPKQGIYIHRGKKVIVK